MIRTSLLAAWKHLWLSLLPCAIACTLCLGLVSAAVQKPASSSGDNDEVGKASSPKPVTRLELLRSLRMEKANRLEPTPRRLLEPFFLHFDRQGNSTLGDTNFRSFYPRLTWVARGSGPAVGTRYWKREAVKGLDLMGSAFYSWNHYQHYDLMFGMIPNRGEGIPPSSFDDEEIEGQGEIDRSRVSRFRLYGSARYRHQASIAYYGSGPDTAEEDRTTFLLKDFQTKISVGYQFTPQVAWVSEVGILRHALGPGREGSSPALGALFTDSTAPGLESPPDYQTTSSALILDFRDDPGAPHKGIFAASGWEKYHHLGGSNLYHFSLWGSDIRGFIPLWSTRRVLALRALALYADATDDNQVPFFLKPSLGGSRGMRGYRSFRFRGDKLLQFQAEYRWEPARRLELALFTDAGMVADKGERLSLSKLKDDFGVGFRVKTSKSTIFRIDQAWGDEGPRLVIRFFGAF